MLRAARIAKKGPKNILLSSTQSFKKLIFPSRTVTKSALPPNSKDKYSSIFKKTVGEAINTRLKKEASDEKMTRKILITIINKGMLR